MPYVIRYRMLTGTTESEASSPQEAVKAIVTFEQAGGQLITILDGFGKLHSAQQVELAAKAERRNMSGPKLTPPQ